MSRCRAKGRGLIALLLLGAALMPREPAVLAAPGLCLRLMGPRSEEVAARIPITPGTEVQIVFRHSLYGSRVEESLRVEPDGGLMLVRLRYEEARTAEYYGQERAVWQQGWWVVEGRSRRLGDLRVRVPPDSDLRLLVGGSVIPAATVSPPGGLLRLAVGPCV